MAGIDKKAFEAALRSRGPRGNALSNGISQSGHLGSQSVNRAVAKMMQTNTEWLAAAMAFQDDTIIPNPYFDLFTRGVNYPPDFYEVKDSSGNWGENITLTVAPTTGGRAVTFDNPSTGGRYLQSTSLFPVDSIASLEVGLYFSVSSSSTAVVQVGFELFDEDLVSLGDTLFIDDPSVNLFSALKTKGFYSIYVRPKTLDSSARYARLYLGAGGGTGTVQFDRLLVRRALAKAKMTRSGNEVIALGAAALIAVSLNASSLDTHDTVETVAGITESGSYSWLCPETGWYQITGTVEFNLVTVNTFAYASIIHYPIGSETLGAGTAKELIRGQWFPMANTTAGPAQVHGLRFIQAGSYLRLGAFADDTSYTIAGTSSDGYGTGLEIVKVG